MASRSKSFASDDAAYDDYDYEIYERHTARRPKRGGNADRAYRRREQRLRDRRRVEISKPFKCRHCKSFIGLPLTGGRQRNHCPNCLHSLHVDGKTPGDRASDCGSLMAPVATFFRPNGEQVVLHRCLGCGFERYNRIAADDSPLLLMRLPLVEPRTSADSRHNEEPASA